MVRKDACTDRQPDCTDARGVTFDPHASTTWEQDGNYSQAISQGIGPNVQGALGKDRLGLGIQGSGGPSLKEQGVVTYAATDPLFGVLGANALSVGGGEKSEDIFTYIESLKDKRRIPSLSLGYTAGNKYRGKYVYGSLTLGGYDSSLRLPNPLLIPFTGDDPSRNIRVNIQAIFAKDQAGKTTSLLDSNIVATIDPAVSMLWLPASVCKAFEDEFGLDWDPESNLYLVDDDTHNQLRKQNASVTFKLSNQTADGSTAEITLPYNSFDLEVKPPYPGISSQQQYFPLQRAANESQIVLGRTFLQEAYVTIDWDRRNFSISQCNWTDPTNPRLLPIFAPGEQPKAELSHGTKIGIGVGVVLGFLAVCALIGFLIIRKRRARRRSAEEAANSGINPKEGLIRKGFAKGEMGAGIENARFEMEGSDGNALKPYGGRTPPWVDEKAHYPGLGSPEIAEIDGIGHRAELGGAVGFYGGRGVHEMYDPSSVPPIELPTSSSEMASPRGELEDSSPGRSLKSPFSRPSSSSKPSPVRSPAFGLFSRRSRAHSSATDRSSSGVSGPSLPSSPKHAERALGSRGQAHLVSIHRSSGRSAPSHHSLAIGRSQPLPAVPGYEREPYRHERPSKRSSATKQSIFSVGGLPNPPSPAHIENRPGISGKRARHSERSVNQRSSGPSSPSSPRIPFNNESDRHRHGSQVSAPSNGSGHEMFSPISRRETGDVLSPIGPDDERAEREYFGGFSHLG